MIIFLEHVYYYIKREIIVRTPAEFSSESTPKGGEREYFAPVFSICLIKK